MAYYSSPADVIRFVGVTPADLWFEDGAATAQEQLESMLEDWLTQCTDKIHHHQGINYLDEDTSSLAVQGVLDNIAMRMCGNMVKAAMLNRDTNVTRIDEYTVQQLRDFVFTEEIRRELKDLPRAGANKFV